MLLPPRLRKGGSRSLITSLTTITEEDEEQRSRRKKRRRRESDSHLRGDEKKPLSRPDSTTSGNNTYILSGPVDVPNTGRSEPQVLKLDERQKLARERREEREKQNAVREAQLLVREERARLYYEKQLEDRKRRLEEQRIKEERRRVAVEEKRRQKLEEEKARYEAVVRRTLEKSHRVRPKQNRWSWGGTLTSSTSHNSDAERRSVSTMNLSKHIDPVINKRLSSSSATLLNSPDRGLQKQTSLSSSCLVTKVSSKARASREKIHHDRPAGMRRMPLTPWENNVVTRLQTPTHSYLARSRSAMCLSGDAASCHHSSSLSFKTMQSRSSERPIRAGLSLERAVRAGPEVSLCRKATQNVAADRKDKDYVRKSWSNLSCPIPPLNLATTKRAPSPGSQRTKVSQPSSARSSTKPPLKSPTSRRSRSPPPPSSMPLSPSNPSLLPGNLRPSRGKPESPRASLQVGKDLKEEEESKRNETEEEEVEKEKREQSEKKAAAEISPRKAESNGIERVMSPPAVRVSAGTTDPEEASRLLAEKRRQAREQREKEEEEKRQKEEDERQHREEMARKIAEERAKREEEAQRLAEEKKHKEEEERRLEEERLQREREEAERQLKQKEEDEARQREEAERLRQEREKHFQKEEAERLERKKRLEEIMKRTRRSDQKSPSQRNGDVSQQNSQDSVNVVPGIPSITVSTPQIPQTTQHSDSNGHANPDLLLHTLPPAGHDASTGALRENGVVMETFEEVIEVPMVTKLSRQEGDGEEEDERMKAPLIAFRENGSTHDISAWDQSQLQRHAGDV
ncbi:ensconsin isoform X2 [Tachysurus fulvidraco]|uniref:ensconsin isoform X2 n=1 Tax=Tachysurus fulvidraco TaxID=1234273 RepID=UPI001FED7137|nr:ensconsin isoform X2 [Tachysurus fulvidraco]